MINILVIPLSYFIGGMATASPGSTMHDFWKVFFFIQVMPFSLLLLSLVWWFIRRKKGEVIMYRLKKIFTSIYDANKLSRWAAYCIYC
ncbi:hypothetical protein COM03_29595 [Bacillus wiedmannii]|nr:hypothetical protein COM03_29595 [Bacillus wiedmannii]